MGFASSIAMHTSPSRRICGRPGLRRRCGPRSRLGQDGIISWYLDKVLFSSRHHDRQGPRSSSEVTVQPFGTWTTRPWDSGRLRLLDEIGRPRPDPFPTPCLRVAHPVSDPDLEHVPLSSAVQLVLLVRPEESGAALPQAACRGGHGPDRAVMTRLPTVDDGSTIIDKPHRSACRARPPYFAPIGARQRVARCHFPSAAEWSRLDAPIVRTDHDGNPVALPNPDSIGSPSAPRDLLSWPPSFT